MKTPILSEVTATPDMLTGFSAEELPFGVEINYLGSRWEVTACTLVPQRADRPTPYFVQAQPTKRTMLLRKIIGTTILIAFLSGCAALSVWLWRWIFSG